MPSVSPDGKWLAYVSNESGRSEVYVRAIPGPGARIQVSTDGGSEPMWAPPGGGVLFYRGSGKIIRARMSVTPNMSVQREMLFDDMYPSAPVHAGYDVSPDGKRLLFVKPGGGETKTVVVFNWLTDVKQRIDAARQ